MLGNTVGDVRGQAISTRILPDLGRGPRMETTDQGIGTLYGVQCTLTITYVGTLRPNGTIHGSGEGVFMTENGGAGTYIGSGVGHFVRPGVTKWCGSLIFETAVPELAALNDKAIVFEYTVDESGKSEGHLYEWA